MSPSEVFRSPVTPGESWAVRVIPNKFAALSSSLQPTRGLQHLRRRIDGFGFHEVIIESPDHGRCMALMTERRMRHLPVIDQDRLVGMVSIGDLVKNIIAEQQFTIQQLEFYITGEHP